MSETRAQRRRRIAAHNRAALDRISAERVAAGRCRHCGGPVPCSSAFGDIAVGVRRS